MNNCRVIAREVSADLIHPQITLIAPNHLSICVIVFIVCSAVVVELKALGSLSSIEEAQIINYLKVTGLHTGLLLNFGARSLEQKRFILS
jgi:GxxExxY protein